MRRTSIPAVVIAMSLSGCESQTAPRRVRFDWARPGFGPSPTRGAMVRLEPSIPDPLRVGQETRITVTLLDEDARPESRVGWISNWPSAAQWIIPDPPCEQNRCAVLRPLAPTSGPPGSPTEMVTLTVEVCRPDLFPCPSVGYWRRVVP